MKPSQADAEAAVVAILTLATILFVIVSIFVLIFCNTLSAIWFLLLALLINRISESRKPVIVNMFTYTDEEDVREIDDGYAAKGNITKPQGYL